jgi:AraC-like DNA-binding protein
MSARRPRLPTSSVERASDRITMASGATGIERLEARLHGQAYSLHRHDTYAVGITLSGIQTFQFRGERWHCLHGQCHILHPDELHDGGTNPGEAFGYRIVYVDPSLIQDAIGARPLPFVANPVIDGARLSRSSMSEIWDFAEAVDDVTRTTLLATVADLILAASGETPVKPSHLSLPRLRRVRDLIADAATRRHSMDELERIADLDRWTLARQFRAAFGTSPSRFRTLRRLDCVRRSVARGVGLVEAAIAAGFADQSHMSRQFKRAYGMTPGRWATLTAHSPQFALRSRG